MKLGKLNKGKETLVEVEGGVEVGGRHRTEAELYAKGYKKACLSQKVNDDDTEVWHEYSACIVQEWVPAPAPEPTGDDITDSEALEIITGRAAL